MAFKDWVNGIREYFVEDDEDFDEPKRPTQEMKPKVVPNTSKAATEERKSSVVPNTNRTQNTSTAPKTQVRQTMPKRTFVPNTKTTTEKVNNPMPTVNTAISSIAIKEPRAYADIMEAARIIKNGESVLVNFKFMGDNQARRSIDFMTGVAFTLDGDIQNVGGQIFLMTPANITVDAAKEMSVLAGQNFESYDLY
ncbi:cell division protein SepF [Lactococcus nasutitermitis]|uniref:Cell division protein SepF n=1 Tax=Lactococcus nasutitermitis TaxID=1652957 RepID=A0ABV9J9L9_9LACT|nr:cell division protein SepF [Lactococcus nasutitermitis]